ncbi:MAG: undecaprenyldiphospho-muramoylpentapeptide beta-N-acetylglucosaminyltransferase [Magnetococcales bacterium]|nr:undecaprenyldiphospho-muramoylpentapeptide beta-N-acetylglucosaminyltransferase [Magnetococcales bacterium]
MTPSGKRLVLAGGGTGGHLFPALAVADAWEAGGGETLFIGAEGGMECRLVPGRGKRLITLQVGRLQGKGIWTRIQTLLGLPAAIRAARQHLQAYAPHAVLGMGGYASAPTVLAARLLKIPTLLHEQNAIPGLTNRRLGRLANRVLTGFEQATGFFPAGQAIATGNPVGRDFPHPFPEPPFRTPDMPLNLLIFGGSQGAHIFTAVVPEVILQLHQQGLHFRIRQQARPEDLEKVRRPYQQAGIPAEVEPFFADMVTAYREAHLVIARSGASSMAELALTGRAALLVPYPFAADDHQRANAHPLTAAGGAWTCLQPEFTVPWLLAFLKARHQDPAGLLATGNLARTLAKPRAAAEMVTAILQLLADERDSSHV